VLGNDATKYEMALAFAHVMTPGALQMNHYVMSHIFCWLCRILGSCCSCRSKLFVNYLTWLIPS